MSDGQGGGQGAGPLHRWQQGAAARVAASTRSRRWVLWTLLIGVGSTSFPISVFGASLPIIATDLGTSETTITWVITAPILGFAIAMPILGKLGDLHGHRRVYIIGFAASTAIALLTATAWDAPSLIAFRTLGQISGAATGPASMAILLSVFSREDRVKAIGWWSLVVAGSPVVGLVVGGPLIETIGWRALFVIQAIPAAIAVLVAIPVLPETERKPFVPFDVAGAVTLGLGVAATLFGLNRGAAWGWSHPAVVTGFIMGPPLVALFVAIERRSDHPLLPLEFFRRRNFAAPIASQLFVHAAYMGGFVLAPFMLAHQFGYTATGITLVMIFRPLAFSALAPVAGYMSTRVGEHAAAVAGTACVAGSMGILALGSLWQSIPLVALGLVLSGGGNGIANPPLTASLANSVDESDLGIATASQIMVGQIGAAIGITVLTVLQGGGDGSAGFVRAFLIGGGIAAVGVGIASAVRSTDRTPGGMPTPDPAAPDELASDRRAAVDRAADAARA